MNAHYTATAERARNLCEYCHAPEAVFNFAFEVEHIQPQAAGGGSNADNLALACSSCNRYKGQAQTVPLFNPRRDVWAEHFEFNAETVQIHGRTATGRVTIERLQMNSNFQIDARRQWVQMGLYP